jgi:hypothetical protein
MSLTTKSLAEYLGRPASIVLSAFPFKDWKFEKSVENDLDETVIDYVFPENGVDFTCDGDDKVSVIILFSNDQRRFDEDLLDVPFSLNRQQVVELLGSASKSGGRRTHPILGESGAWDRFSRPGYSIHIEYQVDENSIKKITLMRADVVP